MSDTGHYESYATTDEILDMADSADAYYGGNEQDDEQAE